MPLTTRQQQILALLEQDERRSIRELQTLTNTGSTSTVRYNLLILERLGKIERDAENTARTWRVVGRPDPAARVVELAREFVEYSPALAEAIREYEAGQ